jgi:tetratricopeptide (TPR) repeat protein
MATRKRIKKDFKEDHLVTYAVEASRWAQEHFNQVIIGVVALVAVIAVVVFTTNSRRSAGEQSARQLGSALALFQSGDFQASKTSFEQIHSRYGGRDAAIALFFQAESELRQAEYEAAIADYDRYLEDASKFPTFRASAYYGKALAYEGLQNWTDAAQTMEQSLALMSRDDPRYLSGAFEAGEFFARAGNSEKAAEYFSLVAEEATGNLQHRATVAAALAAR